MKTAIILLSEENREAAGRLQKELPETTLFSTRPLPGCTLIDSLSDFMDGHFNDYEAFIFFSALGICVRTIAPHIRDKHTDPAVVCVDSTCRYAISVLSGHIGGANRLTGRVSRILQSEAVVTTRSDLSGLWALDTLGETFGWATVFEGDSLNLPISRFVDGEPTALLLTVRDRGTEWMESHLPRHVQVFYRLEDIRQEEFKLLLCVTPCLPSRETVLPELPVVCYLPKAIHLGMGLAREAGPCEETVDAIRQTLQQAGIDFRAVASIASIDVKSNEPVLKKLGESCPLRFYTAEELAAVEVPNPSETVERHVGTPSVCEAAALLASGQDTLLLPKRKGTNFTVAAAIGQEYRRSGHIEIVGAGPGDPDLISVRGRKMLERADLILYAGSLVPREVTACAKPGACVTSSASLDLEQQFALMKEYYDAGKYIVRLHTGDPCIYGAIQEQMNYFDRYGMEYHITPGISSFQAAAAALRSQFTIPERVQSIILTRGEGRTPMPEREKLHLLARSQSTMCIFLSAGIVRQVQEELMQEYPPTTPVAVCHHLTWPDEAIYRGELKDLADIVESHRLTLTTMIVVGEAIGNREGLSRLYAHEFKHLFRK